MDTARTLTRYKAWADARLFDTVATLPETTLTAPQPILFASLLRTLHHAYCMDVVWRAHLRGEAHGLTSRNPEHCPPFDVLRRAQTDIDTWYVAYVDALGADDLAETIEFAFIGGGDGAMTRRDILLHVVNHATYHRGHVADMLYHAGCHPPTTDLPVFLREAGGSA